MKHTIGEWKIDIPFIRINDEDAPICVVINSCHTEEAKANAKLIAQAPKMYDRLCKTNEVLRWAIDEGLIEGKKFQSILDRNLQVIKEATE